MAEYPLKIFERFDPELLNLVESDHELAFEDGALPWRIKLLIAFDVDASLRARGGIRALARESLQAGASKEEIAEALRIAHYINGVGSVYSAAEALRDLFYITDTKS